MIWCPYCKCRATTEKFYEDRCPQCRKVVSKDDVLRTDPYRPKYEKEKQQPVKKFVFDQKGGSDTEPGSGAVKSHPISKLFDIKGRI